MALKVVVPSTLARNESIATLLEAEGCEIVRLPVIEPGSSNEWSAEEIERYFIDADAYRWRLRRASDLPQSSQAATRLRVCASPIIGTETFDVDAATELGIAIGYGAAPENLLGVSEAVVMLTAALLKNLPGKWQAVREGGWRVDDPGHMVMSRTVGLSVSATSAEPPRSRLQGWDCNLFAADPFVKPKDAAAIRRQSRRPRYPDERVGCCLGHGHAD